MQNQKYLYISTATTVDVRELFTLGLTSKRNGDKIGHKGSGLKFTLALLHRLGSSLEVFTPEVKLKSQICRDTIRGVEHEFITLLGSDKEFIVNLPTHITIDAGADTWTEPWFALRELVQNALDEGGEFGTDGPETLADFLKAGELRGAYTIMRILLTPALAEAWENRAQWLHTRHPETIYPSAEKGLFYHGFKIYSEKKWHWAYDVTAHIERSQLSEDRQLRNVNLSELFGKLAKVELPNDFYWLLVRSKEEELPPDAAYLLEHVYNAISSYDRNPGGFKLAKLEEEFERVHGSRAAFTTSHNTDNAEHYFARAAGYVPVTVSWKLSSLLERSERIKSTATCLPSMLDRLETVKLNSINEEPKDRLRTALKLVKRIRNRCPEGNKVRVVKLVCNADSMDAVGMAVPGRNEVLLLESFVAKATVEELVPVLIEEFVHLSSGQSDGSIKFEKALIATIADLIKPRRPLAEIEDSL